MSNTLKINNLHERRALCFTRICRIIYIMYNKKLKSNELSERDE